MPVVRNLRKLRLRKYLSQRELGKIATIDVSTIWRIEQGGGANYETIRKLAKALDVTPAGLTGKADERVAV